MGKSRYLCQSGIRGFFIRQVSGSHHLSRTRKLKSPLGNLEITAQQVSKLGVDSYRQLSPLLESCCLLVSANVSYEQAETDVAYLTEVRISAKTQQRIVHRQNFSQPSPKSPLEEISID